MSGKLWIVVRKEYLERVRTRSFALGTALGPVLIAAMMFGPALLAERTGPESQSIVIVDPGDGQAGERLQSMLDAAAQAQGDGFPLQAEFARVESEGELEQLRTDLDAEVGSDELDGYVVLAEDFLESGRAVYYGESLSGVIGVEVLENFLDQAVQQERMRELGIGSAELAEVLRGANLEKRSVGAEDDVSMQSRLLVGVAMIMLLYFMMIFYGQFTMQAVIEDKSTRVVEVMLASVTPGQLMMGKLLGQGLVGFTQFVIWVVIGGLFSNLGGQVAGLDIQIGLIGVDLWIWFGVFFVLGFLLYSSLYAGVGALCSSMQDAQQYQGPITMLIVLPVLLLQVAIQAPDSGTSLVLSLIPLFTPILMFIRIVIGDPALWQVVLSVVLLLLTVLGSLQLAAKLFRLSILHFGKAPGWGQIMKMLRASD
ncbi:MAG TPA: ABC transporter permease [Candidatus Krumholzibacteria bacterium]|nr:ABC transporter permease [Candidatus Krumholzibacteria bacterium]